MTSLAAIAADLGAIHSELACTVGTPAGDGWLRWSDLREHVGGMVDGLVAGPDGRPVEPIVAATLTGTAVAVAVAARPVAAYVRAGGVVLDVGPGHLYVRWDGRRAAFDGVAYTAGSVRAGGDATDLAAVLARNASSAFAAIRAHTRVAWRSLWGSLADEVTAVHLWLGGAAAIPGAAAVVEGLVALVPDLRSRPTVVVDDGAPRLVRGTCCLWYRTPQAADAVAIGRSRYCSSCPLAARRP